MGIPECNTSCPRAFVLVPQRAPWPLLWEMLHSTLLLALERPGRLGCLSQRGISLSLLSHSALLLGPQRPAGNHAETLGLCMMPLPLQAVPECHSYFMLSHNILLLGHQVFWESC